MKVLITEDDDAKRDEIVEFISSQGVNPSDILTAVDMADFGSKFDASISLCVIDLRLPAYRGAQDDRNGLGILQIIDRRGSPNIKLLAISAYPEEFDETRPQFEQRGCLLVDFKQTVVWQSVLKQMIIQSREKVDLDFIIFCALRSERAPYTAMTELGGQPVFVDNLSRLDVSIAGRRGTVIELPRMGLVDAGVIAGTCIEKFRPKVVAMSGICAGFPDRAELGQLLIADLAYEYQSGKWSTDGFSQEPYQVPISEKFRAVVRELIEDRSLLARLEAGWSLNRPSTMSDPKIVTFTSGSAVIANEETIGQVANHHRRVSGLDMEVYAVYRAAFLGRCGPDFICAKTVVDLAGASKEDSLQPYGCYISSKFLVEALAHYFSKAQ